jgi:peptide/nickel transport system ATP-binding protein
MTPLLEVQELRVRFRVKSSLRAFMDHDPSPFIDAVLGVSFSLAQGQSFGLVGESGSGKTTLAKAIIGLTRAQEGSIRFEDRELIGLSDTAYKPVRRHVAMMFQDPSGSLSPRLTVKAQITEPFRIHGIEKRDLTEEAYRLLDMVNLSESLADHYPHQLSGGQARRVGVAQALALSPKLIIADEPTAGLDVSVQGEILNLMNRLQEELGVSFLIITHNLAVVRHFSDRMAIMYLGRFLEQGPTDEVFARMRHPYTHALLSAHPNPDPDAVLGRVQLRGEVPSLLHRPSGCEFHTRCPFAQKKCAQEFPSKRRVGPDHYHYCHYPVEHLSPEDGSAAISKE